MAQTIIDLAVTCVAGSDKLCVGRQDTGVQGVTSTSARKRRVKGIAGRIGTTTGYIYGVIDGQVVFSIDTTILSAQLGPLPLDLDVPVGSTLSVMAHSVSGTDVAYIGMLCDEGG